MKKENLKGYIHSFAKSLHHSWIAKKSVSESVSNEEIDKIYKIAQENGAIGGKVSGAGGGGFMFFVAPPEKIQLIQRLNDEKGKVFNFHLQIMEQIMENKLNQFIENK